MSRHAVLGIAAVVALGLSACGDDGDGQEPAADEEPEQQEPADEDEAAEEPDGAAAEPITVEAGEMYFEGIPDTIEAGTVAFELDNVGGMEHDIVIEETGDEVVVTASPGETEIGSVELEPGEYTIYCSIGNHRAQGMEETVTVE
jgi:plastocyanin